MSGGRFATRLCRRWVGWYTRSCPPDVAAARRDEIASDVWEHTAAATERGVRRLALDADVLRRVLSGVPADLSWRWEVRRSHRRFHDQGVPVMSRQRHVASSATLVLAAIAAVPATSLIPLLGTGDNGQLSTGERFWVIGVTVLGVALIAGIVVRVRGERPVLGTTLLAIASPAPAMAWFWFPPLYLLSAVLLVLVVATHTQGDESALA